jgi:polyisoprenyl-phosphate glycosyltransferase
MIEKPPLISADESPGANDQAIANGSAEPALRVPKIDSTDAGSDEVSIKANTISVVIPVYQGEKTLEALVAELEPHTHLQKSPGGRWYQIIEVIMVHDGARDASDVVMKSLADHYSFVVPIWLSRNYGQHPATLAGITCSAADWVATLDEDGQQDPGDLGRFLDMALQDGAQLVYAKPTNAPPHGALRNALSKLAKKFFVNVLGFKAVGEFNSYRLIDGEIARSLSAFCGHGVYLDVALAWVVSQTAHCPAALREERERPSGYNLRKLVAHFWRLVLTSGTQPLRLVAFGGLFSMVGGFALVLYALIGKLTGRVPIPGWTSLLIVVSVFSGAILFSLGIISEYLGIVVKMALGKPTYMMVSRSIRQPESRT